MRKVANDPLENAIVAVLNYAASRLRGFECGSQSCLDRKSVEFDMSNYFRARSKSRNLISARSNAMLSSDSIAPTEAEMHAHLHTWCYPALCSIRR